MTFVSRKIAEEVNARVALGLAPLSCWIDPDEVESAGMTFEAKPGFPWEKVRWDDADAPQRDDCSLCGASIPEAAVPLRMWRESGAAAVFCDRCSERWFGLMPIHAGDDDDQEDDHGG